MVIAPPTLALQHPHVGSIEEERGRMRHHRDVSPLTKPGLDGTAGGPADGV